MLNTANSSSAVENSSGREDSGLVGKASLTKALLS